MLGRNLLSISRRPIPVSVDRQRYPYLPFARSRHLVSVTGVSARSVSLSVETSRIPLSPVLRIQSPENRRFV